MTPTQLQPFTLPATLYRYQPGPGYRQGLGASAPLPGLRSSGIRIGAGASRHRPGPLTDTPKDTGQVTFDPNGGVVGEGRLTFIGERTTRTWDMNKLHGYFLHTKAGGDILYFQTTQRQTVEGLRTQPCPDPTTGLTWTLENLLFQTTPAYTETLNAQRQANTTRRARKAAGYTLLAAALLALTANYLAHTPSLAQQAGACDTPEEIATATAAGRALEAEAYTAAGRTRPSDARLYTYTDDQEGC